MIAIFLTFSLVGLVFSIALAVMMNRLRRRRATYRMYEVRDRLVLLVAKEIISEDSPVFKYYYKRTNMLLQFAPNIGLDDAFKAFIYQNSKSPRDLKEAFAKSKAETEKVLKSKDLDIDQVAEAVKLYYISNKEMVLAHSSTTRFIYYAFSHGVKKEWLLRIIPVQIQKALGVIKASGEEYNYINRNHFAQ